MIGSNRFLLATLCIGGALVRILTTYFLPTIAHPDETFQYLEQAYRLSTGHGLIPWEYVVGARSWLLAGLITPIMKAGVMLSPQPAVRLWGVTVFVIGLATVAIVAAFVLGGRVGGRCHAFFAGLLTAFWSEFVYLSPHLLADTVASVPLIGAFALAYEVGAPTARRMLATGVLFGLAFVFRIQLGPAIGLAIVWICGRDVRSRYLPIGLGFLCPLILMGVVDRITWGAPFRSVYVYVLANMRGVAETFGSSPMLSYANGELQIWGVFAPLILVTAWMGGKKLPLVAVEVVAIFLTFSLIGHKEYRFIYPALLLLLVLCGVGTAEAISWIASRVEGAAAAGLAVSVLWLIASINAGITAPLREQWLHARDWLQGFQRVSADPAACGLGVTPRGAWLATGQVRLRPDITLFDATKPTPAAYNYLFVSSHGSVGASDLEPFHRLTCNPAPEGVCIYKRTGGCDPSQGNRLVAAPGPDITSLLRDNGLLP